MPTRHPPFPTDSTCTDWKAISRRFEGSVCGFQTGLVTKLDEKIFELTGNFKWFFLSPLLIPPYGFDLHCMLDLPGLALSLSVSCFLSPGLVAAGRSVSD